MVHPSQVKTAALHSCPKRYTLPSASSAPKISAWPPVSYGTERSGKSVYGGHDGEKTGPRRRTHLDCERGVGVELKPVLRLGLESPLSGVNVHVLTSIHHVRHRFSTPSSVSCSKQPQNFQSSEGCENCSTRIWSPRVELPRRISDLRRSKDGFSATRKDISTPQAAFFGPV